MIPRVSFITLGCRLNQLETESLATAFKDSGFEIISSSHTDADIYVINTCTVTSMAEQKARRLIRKAITQEKNPCVIVTGCYAELDQKSIENLGSGIIVIPLSRKSEIIDLAQYLMDSWTSPLDTFFHVMDWQKKDHLLLKDAQFRFSPYDFNFHSRASLKIQDGCDNECTYCRVRLARGKGVSLDAHTVIERANELQKAGFSEIVLTGINLSQYKSKTLSFSNLLSELLLKTNNVSYRISSLEPETPTDSYLEPLKDNRIRPFFHLAIQSMSDSILKSMDRHYTSQIVDEMVHAIRSVRSDPFFGADIISGFPGETTLDFEITKSKLEFLDISFIHAFSFSPRPGTKAALLSNKVQDSIITMRTKLINQIARQNKLAYVNRIKHKPFVGIIEQNNFFFSEHGLKFKIDSEILYTQREEKTALISTVKEDHDTMGTVKIV